MQHTENFKTKSKFLNEFLKYRYLLSEIVRRNIKVQYRDSILGIFWTFLQPLLTTVVLVMVFGGMFGKDPKSIINYPIYLLCGRLMFDFYSQATKRGMRSISTSASIIKKVYVPKYIYPLGNTLSCFVTFLISLLVLIAFIAYYMIFTDTALRLTPYILLSIVPIVILYLLSFGVGMILATMSVFFKDIEYLYDVFCMLLFYLTPIFYQVEQLNLNKYVLMTLMANPLYSVVSMFRSCVLFGEMWNWNWFYYSFGFSIVVIAFGSWLFKKTEDKFILHI